MRHQVLIVDPNEAFATMLRQSLDETGNYDAIAVDSGRKALRAIASDSYDMVIVDLGLEDVEGTLLVKRLREDYPDMRLMVIPLFGESPPEETTALDIQGVLPKPFFLPELPDLIDAAFNKPVGRPILQPTGDAEGAVDEEPSGEAEEDGQSLSDDEGLPAKDDPAEAAGGPFPWDIDLSDDAVEDVSEPKASNEPPPPPPVTTPEPEINVSPDPPPPSGSYDWSNEVPFLNQQLTRLLQEVRAQAAILVNGNDLIAQVSRLPTEEVDALATIIQESWQTSARVAQILGKEQLRFEQSIEGDEHLLYSLALSKETILSVIVEGHVALGMIRHRSKETAEAIRRRLGITG